MTITTANEYQESVIELLASLKLPYQDLPAGLTDFLVVVHDGRLAGVAGMEIYGQFGLLRSVAVSPDFRKQSVAASLVAAIEKRASVKGLSHLYLLTETAADYFGQKGFETVKREAVPEALRQSSEFSHVCPQSAIIMKKQLENT